MLKNKQTKVLSLLSLVFYKKIINNIEEIVPIWHSPLYKTGTQSIRWKSTVNAFIQFFISDYSGCLEQEVTFYLWVHLVTQQESNTQIKTGLAQQHRNKAVWRQKWKPRPNQIKIFHRSVKLTGFDACAHARAHEHTQRTGSKKKEN